MLSLWVNVAEQPFDYVRFKIINRLHSIDTHFPTVVVTVSFSLLAIKAAIMLVMHDSMQIAFQVQYFQDTKLLTLR
jgi:hypothetical protein